MTNAKRTNVAVIKQSNMNLREEKKIFWSEIEIKRIADFICILINIEFFNNGMYNSDQKSS